MADALSLLWPLVDIAEPVATAAAAATWPAGVHERLLGLGFLVPARDAAYVLCPECGEHQEEVIACDGPGESTRLFIPCPQVLRATVPPEALRQWQVSVPSIAAALATTLGVTGRCAELKSGRLWRLGRTEWQGASRDVLFARGLHWSDAATVRAAIVRARKPILFVASQCPPSDFWQRRVPPTLALAQVVTLGGRRIEIDALEITAAIHSTNAAAVETITTTITIDELKLMIRNQITASQKTELTDPVFIGAYRRCGSVRAAATLLSEETQQHVSKDKIHRALERAGGAAAVLNSEDSDSVLRGVSQRRDKKGKVMPHAKPIEGE